MSFEVGDRVWVAAKYFDQGSYKDQKERWSFSVYGEEWETAECHGVVESVTFDKAGSKMKVGLGWYDLACPHFGVTSAGA